MSEKSQLLFLQLKKFLNSESNKLQAKKAQRASVEQQKPFLAELANSLIVIIPVKISTLKTNLDKELPLQGHLFHLNFLLLLISTWSTL